MTTYRPNLYRWGMREDPLFRLCGSKGTMAHILFGCEQGRYSWGHVTVLAGLADILEQRSRKKHPAKTRLHLCKMGSLTRHPGSSQAKFPAVSPGMRTEVDLGRKLHFLEAVLSKTLKPDIVLWSPEGKKTIPMELTVPWEEGCE